MIYTIKYKKPEWLFWRKIKRVKGDILEKSCWVIVLDDESQIVLPPTMMMRFPKERFVKIHKQMEAEAGKSIPLKVD